MSILIVGGTGYIGSHTTIEIIKKNKDVIVVDNLSNSNIEVLNRIEELTATKPKFYKLDVQDREKLEIVFKENNIESVIHFAAFKCVGESVKKPLQYYSNNIVNTIVLLEMLKKYDVKKFVFSSSAAVYGNQIKCPIKEEFPLAPTNPYGQTKFMIENILRDICKVDKSFNVAILRYFNPVGAHKSGRVGEDTNGKPNNLIPYITKVAIGELEELYVFGSDYNTSDGTGVRDYIHVVDLALAHIKVLDKLDNNPGLLIYNIGTGKGYSVLDVINAFSKISGIDIKYKIVDRRIGDIGICYADTTKAKKELGWQTKYNLYDMCQDSWRWKTLNPNGYKKDKF